MKRILSVLLVLISTMLSDASEPTYPLKSKVQDSDLVALVTFTGLEQKGLSEVEYFGEQMEILMTMEVNQILKGKANGEIKVQGFASEYNKGDGGWRGSSVGLWSTNKKSKRKYLVYAKKTESGYCLTLNSDQYFELVSINGKKVEACGQTTAVVALDWKFAEILRLAKLPAEKPLPNNAQHHKSDRAGELGD